MKWRGSRWFCWKYKVYLKKKGRHILRTAICTKETREYAQFLKQYNRGGR